MRRSLIALCLLALPVGAQDGGKVDIKLPVVEHILDNGMKVLVVERHDVPRVYCALYWKVGSVNERPGITGLSHFFEHMMFKGTKVIGTKDAAKDAELNGKIEATMTKIREIKLHRLEADRLGQSLPKQLQERYETLWKEYEGYIEEQKKITISEDLSKIYQRNGGTGLNATTSFDRTNYFIELPSNKVELFFWLEGDRFSAPVFREFYPEREVVKEERRMRYDSTPTGLIDIDFRAAFWQAHPYSWPVIGWMSDIDQYTLTDAQRYFDIHYSPRNCTAIFVGDVKAADIHALAKKYFGKLKNSTTVPDPIVTLEPKQTGERRMVAEADSNPNVEVAWHAPSQAHKDGTPLDVMCGILDGRTGRLWKRLVDEKKLALSASAGFWGLKYGGMIMINAAPAQGVKPEALEAEIYSVVAELGDNGPTEKDLRKVKNQMIANTARGLQTNSEIGNALGSADMIHDWRDVLNSLQWIEDTTADDVKRLVKTYLTAGGRNVLIINRREGK